MAIAQWETNAGGAPLQIQAEVAPRFFRPEDEEQAEFAQALVDAVREAADEYTGSEELPTEYPDEAVESLAHTLNGIGELREALDEGISPAEAMLRLNRIDKELARLSELDPRFVPARYFARRGWIAAGDFDLGAVEQVCAELPGLLPAPEQTDEGLAFHASLWTEDPAPELEVYAEVADIMAAVTLRTDGPAFGVLRALAAVPERMLDALPGLPPASFYAEAAYAKQVSDLRFTDAFQEDNAYRRLVIDALAQSLKFLAAHSPRYEFPLDMADVVARMAERTEPEALELGALMGLLEHIQSWLPRAVNDLVPPWWFGEDNEDSIEGLVASLTADQYVRMVAVMDASAGQLTDEGLPDRAAFQAIPVDDLTMEMLAAENVTLFAEEL